jgi:predicted amino acid-binding ACT domain protein
MTKNSAKKSVRVQMYPETERCLEQIATEHNCLRGYQPSIAELLAQIHSGRLIVSKASVQNKPDNSTIGFRIEVPRYLVGTIGIISEKIAKYQGNITAVKTKSSNNLGVLQVFLSLPSESSLSSLITELESITIKELAHLNEKSELKSIANDWDLKLVGGRTDIDIVESFLKKKLICDMACVIGFQLITIDKVGILAKIANQIAKARLLIYSVSENVGDDINEAIIKLFLYLRPTAESSIAEQIEKIDGVIKRLKKEIEAVKKVEPLGVDSLD